MKLIKLLNILASENKLKIIIHYWNCSCNNQRCVSDLQDELNLSQSNLSKHLTALKEENILDVEIKHKERVYSLNKEFKKQWASLIDPIANNKEMQSFVCQHCLAEKH